MTLQITIDVGDRDTAGQLVYALTNHMRWCRERGLMVAPGLSAAWKQAQVVARGLSGEELDDPPHSDVVEPLLLTLPQAAELLGCSVSKVKSMIAKGQLPTVDFDGVRRIRRTDVENLVAGGSFRDHVEAKADPSATGRRLGPADTSSHLRPVNGSASREEGAR